MDRDSWARHENVESLPQFLLEEVGSHYGGKFPPTAKIYQEYVDNDHDITPKHPKDLAKLHKLSHGTVYVVVWPGTGEPITTVAWAVIAVAAFVVRNLFFADDTSKQRQLPKGSPNNQPGDRQNTARVLQRIPDIYGRVKATPDLLTFPYISYENNLQVELTYMCIGRGSYTIDAEEVFEGATRVDQLPASSVEIYPPNNVPGGGIPQLTIGQPITDPLYSVVPVRGVTGEVLLAPNNVAIFGQNDTGDAFGLGVAPAFRYLGSGVGEIRYFTSPGVQYVEGQEYITRYLAVGDKIGLVFRTAGVSSSATSLVEGAGGSGLRPDLELLPDTPDYHHYEITDIDDTTSALSVTLTVSVPSVIQSEWEKIATYNPGAEVVYNNATIVYSLNYRQGPFFCNDPSMEEVHLNFVAERGLWVDDGRTQRPYGSSHVPSQFPGVELIIELTPADEFGVASGMTEQHSVTMHGSANRRDLIGITAKITPSFTGRFLVAVYRNTLEYFRRDSSVFYVPNGSEDNWTGSALSAFGAAFSYFTVKHSHEDEIRWTHAYGMSEARYEGQLTPLVTLGQVTTVHSRIVQMRSQRSPAGYEKNLNMIVTRNIGLWDGSTYDTSPLLPVRDGASVLFSVLKDPAIGGLSDSNIDFQTIGDAFAAVQNSFGSAEVIQFDHTFDAESISLEDMIAAIGDSCFVTIYRQGDVIKATPDISSQDATILFNHRNKKPGSETRSVSFGTEENYDGVEIEYTTNSDEQILTYTIPAIGIPRNPRKIRVAGVRSAKKAAFHAWRAYNRLLYQNTVVEFDSWEEGALAIVRDRVLIADNTRPTTRDGEIVKVDGLDIWTSQPVTGLSGDLTMFVQYPDASVQALPVSVDSSGHLTLLSSPSSAITVDADNEVYPKYVVVENQSTVPKAYTVVDKKPKTSTEFSITAVNYSEGYFFYDGIKIWMPFIPYTSAFPSADGFEDVGPDTLDVVRSGTNMVIGGSFDPVRGTTFLATTDTSNLQLEDLQFTSNAGYTIAFWVKDDGTGSNPVFFTSLDPTSRLVFGVLTADDEYYVSHDNVFVMNVENEHVLNEWRHLAVTYNPDTEILNLYLNGEVLATETAVADFTSFDGCQILSGLVGRADSFRLYRKEQPPEFIRELYQKELL